MKRYHKKIIHLSNKGRYNELKALQVGTWDIIAKHHTLCWGVLISDNILVTNNPQEVTCQNCIKILQKRGWK